MLISMPSFLEGWDDVEMMVKIASVEIKGTE